MPAYNFLPGLHGSVRSPAQHVAPNGSPWLSSGSQKHFFSSGKQLQVPKPALIPQRSPGSCPPMMLPPPGDRKSPLSLVGDLTSQDHPDRSVRGLSSPDVSCSGLRAGVEVAGWSSELRSLGHLGRSFSIICSQASSLATVGRRSPQAAQGPCQGPHMATFQIQTRGSRGIQQNGGWGATPL